MVVVVVVVVHQVVYQEFRHVSSEGALHVDLNEDACSRTTQI